MSFKGVTRMLVGFAAVDITPEIPIELGGYIAREKPAEGVLDRIMTKIIAIGDAREPVILISIDAQGVSKDFTEEVDALISSFRIKHQANEEMITARPKLGLIAATHTHSGPSLAPGLYTDVEQKWREYVVSCIRDGVHASVINMQPFRVTIAEADLGELNWDRRKGKPAKDQSCHSMVFRDSLGNVLGVIVNFASHPTVLGPDNLLVSADYPGVVVRALESHWPGSVAAFFTGAAGDTNVTRTDPAATAQGRSGHNRTPEYMQRVGVRLAETVIVAHTSQAPMSLQDSSIGVDDILIRLPLSPMLEENEELLDFSDLQSMNAADVFLDLKRVRQQALQIKKGQEFLQTRVRILRLGPVIMIGIPGEPFSSIGTTIRRLWEDLRQEHDTFSFVIGYANDYVGYLPTDDVLSGEGYEVKTSPYREGVEAAIIVGVQEYLARLVEGH